MNNVHTEHYDNTAQFEAKYENLLHNEEVTPFVVYEGDEHYTKTMFGFAADLKAFQYNDNELSDRKTVKRVMKNSKVKLAKGDHFVFRKTPTGHEIIPGFGIVLSNLYARMWTAADLDQMIGMPNVRGVLWEVPNEGLIYYEATDTPGPQVQTMWYGDDS